MPCVGRDFDDQLPEVKFADLRNSLIGIDFTDEQAHADSNRHVLRS